MNDNKAIILTDEQRARLTVPVEALPSVVGCTILVGGKHHRVLHQDGNTLTTRRLRWYERLWGKLRDWWRR